MIGKPNDGPMRDDAVRGDGAGRGRGEVLILLAALALWGALAAAYVARLDGRAQDDHYITYRYAQNLARGEGLVYNPGERVFGLSEPGHALLLAALHAAARVDIPRTATLLYAAALVLLAAVMLEQAWRRQDGGGRRTSRRRPEASPASAARRDGAVAEPAAVVGAVLGGALLLASSAIWTNHGSAGAAVLALLAIAARGAGERPALAGLLAGAAVWLRPDAAAGAALLGALLAWETRRLPWRYAAAAGAAILAGVTAAWVWFGTPLPETVAAKRADALAGAGDGWGVALAFWSRAADLAPRHFGDGWRALVVAGLLGLIPLWRHGGRPGRLLVLYGAAVALAYTVLGVPFFSWYLLPVLAALFYGVAFAVAATAGWIGKLLSGPRRFPAAGGSRPLDSPSGADRFPGNGRRAAVAVVVALVAFSPLLVPFGRAAWRWQESFSGYGHLDTYRRAAAWLRRETPPATRVAYVEIGVLGFESRRPIVDLMGLVTRETRPYVAARDVPGAFLASPAEIVIFHTRGRMRPLLRRPWFHRAYTPVARFDDRAGGGRLTIYRRLPGATLQAPRNEDSSAGDGDLGPGDDDLRPGDDDSAPKTTFRGGRAPFPRPRPPSADARTLFPGLRQSPSGLRIPIPGGRDSFGGPGAQHDARKLAQDPDDLT